MCRRGLDVHSISFVYVFFRELSYVEYCKESTISWDSLMGKFPKQQWRNIRSEFHWFICSSRDSDKDAQIVSASFGGIFSLCLGGSMISLIELIYHLVRQVFKGQLCKTRKRTITILPPASKIFIPSVSKEKVWRQKLRNHQEYNKNVTKNAFVIKPFVREENQYCPIFSRAHQALSQNYATRWNLTLLWCPHSLRESLSLSNFSYTFASNYNFLLFLYFLSFPRVDTESHIADLPIADFRIRYIFCRKVHALSSIHLLIP